jgi:sugar phosphate isomerase/epimerase
VSGLFQIGLNPYGLSYTVGLQAAGTPRANPDPIGLDGFLALVRALGLGVIELDHRWLTPLSDDELARLGERLSDCTRVCSFWLSQTAGETLADAVRCTRGVGARILRFHLTPVLEGARASHGARWDEMVEHARATLRRESARIADAGLVLAIEDHQDFGSEELVAFAEDLGTHAGVTFDTGNPYAVGEDPVAFVRRAAPRIRHVHLKDYVAQFTDEGYRLVRCAAGDGCVPFPEIADVLGRHHESLTASIEIGALDARHIRLFTPDWWRGYPPRQAQELGEMLGRLRRHRLNDAADYRTPWEERLPHDQLVAYEMDQVRRSVENMRTRGWVPGG